jgi:acyl carrier protein
MKIILNILSDIRPEFDFSKSDNFIEDGMLDSFDIITLVTELDQKYGISIDGLDILPENFSSLQQINNLIIKNGGNI